MKELPDLLPADCLLYKPGSLFGWIIAVKTWTLTSHVEIYTGGNNSVASRDGAGVNIYPLRTTGLAYVMRPIAKPDIDSGLNWFYSKACGQAYDVLGLCCFYLAAKQGSPTKMFCSEFATRFYRNTGIKPFNPNYDADRIAPAQFLQSPAFEEVWRAD